MTLRRASLALAAFVGFVTPLHAQDPLGWNSPRVLELIERARARRELPRGDSSLHNYQAKARGFVYFYLDRRDSDERTLVKVDQIALDLFWKRPALTKQNIVGMRDVSRLPNRMHYHLDHLTVVQNGLGDVIRIGDGDEVRDVPHPAAPGAETVYDFRLADSVTLQLGGGQPEVRVYQINVRPKRTDRPAFVGSIYVDRASADIVRLTFTFTPASYVDRRLDYINISLDNGLFGGTYWLPSEQSLEIRRQLPELDFVAGAVIKGRLRISDYKFNEPLADSVFYGRPVSAALQRELENYPFEEQIYAGIVEEGLAPPPQMAELRAQAAALVRERRLSGLPPWRVYIPNASSVVRHNRAEGWYGGLGVAYVPSPTFRLDGLGGYAFGAEKPLATLAARIHPGNDVLVLRGYYNEPRDIGPIPGLPGVLNTITSGFGDDDYTDVYFTRGASADFSTPLATTWRAGVLLRLEKQRAALARESYRTFLGVADGTAGEAAVRFERVRPASGTFGWGGSASAAYIRFVDEQDSARSIGRFLGNIELRLTSSDTRTSLNVLLDGGTNAGTAPPQYDFLLGGRETLPGFHYREFEGTSYALLRTELARTVASPWIRARLLGNAAYFHGREIDGDLVVESGRIEGSAGVGLGLLWDAIRVDVYKGRHWQTVVSIKHDFWDML